MKYQLKINGRVRQVDAEPDMPLLWAVRDLLGMTGTRFGCGVASCGACTMHLNGAPIRSCSFPVSAVGDSEVVTIEGLNGKVANAVQQAWRDNDVVQCGYCQSGQIMSAVGLLSGNAAPSDAEIDGAMGGNACRCATYLRIREAIHEASKMLEV